MMYATNRRLCVFDLPDQIMLFFAAFASIAAAILAGFNLYDRIKAAKKPHDDHIKQVKDHEQKLLRDFETIKEMQAEQRILLQNDLLVMEHIINGNHVDKLQEQRDFIHRYLIERS